MACHLVLLVPIITAGLFLLLPWTTALPAAAALAAGTALIVYPTVRALRRPVVTGREALLGAPGQAVSDLSPEGLVRVRSEIWVAEATQPVGRGGLVRIVEVRGLRLRVQPWDGEGRAVGPGCAVGRPLPR